MIFVPVNIIFELDILDNIFFSLLHFIKFRQLKLAPRWIGTISYCSIIRWWPECYQYYGGYCNNWTDSINSRRPNSKFVNIHRDVNGSASSIHFFVPLVGGRQIQSYSRDATFIVIPKVCVFVPMPSNNYINSMVFLLKAIQYIDNGEMKNQKHTVAITIPFWLQPQWMVVLYRFVWSMVLSFLLAIILMTMKIFWILQYSSHLPSPIHLQLF